MPSVRPPGPCSLPLECKIGTSTRTTPLSQFAELVGLLSTMGFQRGREGKSCPDSVYSSRFVAV